MVHGFTPPNTASVETLSRELTYPAVRKNTALDAQDLSELGNPSLPL
jgi:hypothetical protein